MRGRRAGRTGAGRARRTPNQALRLLLREAGWSGARLAREVNALGAAQGTPLSYDRTAVAHWLAGSRPRRPAPALVAEALSRGLGRPVREGDAGFGPARGAAQGERDAVESLDEALRTTGRRRVTLAGAYSLAALTLPCGPLTQPYGPQAKPHASRPGVSGAPAGAHGPPFPRNAPPVLTTHTTHPSLPSGRVDAAHVASARELLALFSRGDAVLGGGPVYEPLRQYLAATVLPWLKRDMRPAVRRELLTVASRLTYLCAFTHFDMNRHAAAQRLYLTSAELAGEAGDRVGRGLALRGLSVQAHALGHFAEAHRLAEQAASAALRHVPPHQKAFFHGQLAVTLAGRGDAGHARHLSLADRCLERSSSGGSTPVGAFHPGSLALQRAAVAVSLGDRHAAARALDLSLRHRPADERRSRALSLAELAETQLAMGHLEQACRTWHEFLDGHPVVDSARADDRLRLLIARTRPYSGNPAVNALLGRVHETHRRHPPTSRGPRA
ncbi:tetratricopeptide repeat protein [Streptomyces sp. YPW6]|uniref:tetratricopeptide repeat protein n=1 Tax=Streptomyces sp. YPW6 TaxID=2840373 RepID=UPI003D70563C